MINRIWGSKTTMTSGAWTCLISFATAPLTCSERGGSEKFKMKIYVSSGIRTHTPPVHDRKGLVYKYLQYSFKERLKSSSKKCLVRHGDCIKQHMKFSPRE